MQQNHGINRKSRRRRRSSWTIKWAAIKLELVNRKKRSVLSMLASSMLDQNKLATVIAVNEIINSTGAVNRTSLILPETSASAMRHQVAVKNSTVKSIPTPRSSGKFLYRPANRKSTKVASIDNRSAQRRPKRGDLQISGALGRGLKCRPGSGRSSRARV